MKFFISIVAMVVLAKDCKNNSQVKTDQDVQDTIEITYVANTRGFYEYMNVTKKTITFSKDRDLKTVTSIKCSKENWNELIGLLSKIEVAKISELEPPSKKFQFDGAPMATLEIKNKDQLYKTKIFDHENPPKDITTLVNKVLSLKDIVVKN